MDYGKPDMVPGLSTESIAAFIVAKPGHFLQIGQAVSYPTSSESPP
jgi:hypothetical protein